MVNGSRTSTALGLILFLVLGPTVSADSPDEPFFYPHPVYGTLDEPYYAVAADLNDDGAQDVVVSSADDPEFAVLLGRGNGRFDLAVASENSGTVSVLLGNGDTRLDLVTVNYGSADLRVFVGNGDGSFSAGPPPQIYALPGPVTTLELADLNGDGISDLVGGGSSVQTGNGDGTFGAGTAYVLFDSLLASGDFDLDGRVDLVGDDESKVRIAFNLTGPRNSASWPTA